MLHSTARTCTQQRMRMNKARVYSLYKRVRGSKHDRWIRISDWQFHKESAVRMFQNQLIGNALGMIEPQYEYRLRPVLPPRDRTEPAYKSGPVKVILSSNQ